VRELPPPHRSHPLRALDCKEPGSSRQPKMRRRFSIRCASLSGAFRHRARLLRETMSSIRSSAHVLGWITTAGRRSNGQPRN